MKRGAVEIVIISLIALIAILALVFAFSRGKTTGQYMHEQSIYVSEDNPCLFVGCEGHLGREAKMIGMQGLNYICACPEDLKADGTPKPGTEHYISMLRKY